MALDTGDTIWARVCINHGSGRIVTNQYSKCCHFAGRCRSPHEGKVCDIRPLIVGADNGTPDEWGSSSMSDWTLPPMPIPAEAREHIRRFLNGWPLHEDFTAGTVTHRTGCVDCGGDLVDDHRCPACDPCSCGGRRWIEDEGWSPGYHPAPDRLPGDGLIPCRFCSDGERDSGQQITPPEPLDYGSNGTTR